MKRLCLALVLVLIPAYMFTGPGNHRTALAAPQVSQKFVHACGPAGKGFARCNAILVETSSTQLSRFAKSNPRRPTPTPGTPTNTPPPTATKTPRPTPTNTLTPTVTNTPSPTATATATSTPGGCTSPAPTGSDPNGFYSPADLQSAYNLASRSASTGCTQTVGIVDAYDDPNAESDLATYRSHYGLPACTTANGCFRKVNQTGGTTYPTADTGWAEEISLDLDMVSAICPNCHILLVEANTNGFNDLASSVNEAVALGANAVSNSYGSGEFLGQSTYAPYYSHSGVIITASTGDNGFAAGEQLPAAYSSVVAVGGTSLTRASNSRGWTESAWSSAGSGCSAYVSQPSWQKALSSVTSVCANRASGDVSAVADPGTAVGAYDSYGVSGWVGFGGTSVSSPIIASVFALAGNESSIGPSYPYSHTSSLNDVTGGSNGSCGTLLCNGATGWDGPTGLGSPNGVGAF